jgi:predicted RecB family endonuclease
MKSAKINGKRKSLYKTNKNEGTKTALMDRIDQAAQQLAVATKIGGIKPMNYKKAAVNDKRVKQLAENLSVALGQVLISKIVK